MMLIAARPRVIFRGLAVFFAQRRTRRAHRGIGQVILDFHGIFLYVCYSINYGNGEGTPARLSIRVLALGEGVAQSPIHDLEMAISLSRTHGQIVGKSHPQNWTISICGSLHAAFEIHSSLVRLTNEDGKNRDEENIALQVWESAPDEICLLTVEEQSS